MYLLVAAFLILADQLSKIWAVNTFTLGRPESYIGLGFYFTYIQNTGAAFGILQGGALLLGLLSASVALVILIYLLRNVRTLPSLQVFALTLIFSGAVGNMIDRLWLGYVRDFIHFMLPNFNFAVFNLADSYVVIGAGLLLIGSFIHPAEKAAEVTEKRHEPLSDPEFFQHADISAETAHETQHDPSKSSDKS